MDEGCAAMAASCLLAKAKPKMKGWTVSGVMSQNLYAEHVSSDVRLPKFRHSGIKKPKKPSELDGKAAGVRHFCTHVLEKLARNQSRIKAPTTRRLFAMWPGSVVSAILGSGKRNHVQR